MTTAPGRGNHTIVLVDDHEDTLAAFVNLLRLHGFDVEGFTSADSAMQRVTQGPEPCLLIVDYDLGPVQGDEFIQRVRDAGVRSPVVVTTGLNPRDIDVRALHQSAVAHVLMKPFSLDDIFRLIDWHGRGGCRSPHDPDVREGSK